MILPANKSSATIVNAKKTLKQGVFGDSDEENDFKPIA